MPAKPEDIPEEYARFQALLRQVVKPDPKPAKADKEQDKQ
jgi:hypothetical protein